MNATSDSKVKNELNDYKKKKKTTINHSWQRMELSKLEPKPPSRLANKKNEYENKNCDIGSNFGPDRIISSNESTIVSEETVSREVCLSNVNYVESGPIRSNGMVNENGSNLYQVEPNLSTSHESYTNNTIPDFVVSSSNNIEIVPSFVSSSDTRSSQARNHDESEENCLNNFEDKNLGGNTRSKKYSKEENVNGSHHFITQQISSTRTCENQNIINQNSKRPLYFSNVSASNTDHSISDATTTSKSRAVKRIRSPYFTRDSNSKEDHRSKTSNMDNVAQSVIAPRVNIESNHSEERQGSHRSQKRTQKGRNNRNKSKEEVERTFGFDACWAGNLHKTFPSTQDNRNIKIHTLILGTHPSVKSLSEKKYYAHPLNAFWWIAGDCLGFRRDKGVSSSTKIPYEFTKDLYYKRSHIIPYQKQIETFCNHGFALWDIIRSCQRQGSLDKDIRNEEVNDIRSFCQAHPTIRRIVFSNGQTQCKLFMKHFNDWWAEGESSLSTPRINSETMVTILIPEKNEASKKIFGKRYSKRILDYAHLDENENLSNISVQKSAMKQTKRKRKIVCVCMPGVSPANAKTSYKTKRDIWKKYCYDPGLRDHEEMNIF